MTYRLAKLPGLVLWEDILLCSDDREAAVLIW